MATKAERGTKRVCGECGGKFYDLNRDPIICPLCEAVYTPQDLEPPIEEEKPAAEEKVAAKTPEEADPVEPDAPEFVSLEDADAEQGADDDDIDEDVIVDLGEDPDIPDDEDDDNFLEEDEEDGADVADIVPAKVDPADEG
ncbi:MAG: TIGR02300 family protein [Alphaproteobacteria bacterium]|nr:MAG: TIGR02300 family protein [Alphaproteobacteria bacterium]